MSMLQCAPAHAGPAIGTSTPIASRWQLIVSAPASGVENMAMDEALMEQARDSNRALARIYGWSAPTLSFGRNQVARGAYDERAAAERGIGIVRRPTGGRALLHHREITYAVGAPVHSLSLREAYGRINAILVLALRSLGLDVRLAGYTRARRPDIAPCFAEPSEGEIVMSGRKLVGSAQWRDGTALLQHGSILIDDDQPAIASLMTVAAPAGVPAPATLRESPGGVPTSERMGVALATAIERCEGVPCDVLHDDADLRAHGRRFAPRYEDPAWTWRR